MSGHAGTTFRHLTLQEKDSQPELDSDAEVAVAIDRGGKVVSFFYYHGQRGPFCTECDKSCVTTIMLWTAPHRRDEGIFKALFGWVMSERRPIKVYESTLAPAGDRELIRYKYDIDPGKYEQVDITYQEAEARAVATFGLIQGAVDSGRA